MPFRRRYKRRRRYKKIPRSIILAPPEKKRFDDTTTYLNIGGAAFDADGTQMLTIVQNNTKTGRIGGTIFVHSILFNWKLVLTTIPAEPKSIDIVFYLFLDKQCNKGMPAVADVFSAGSPGTELLNLDNAGRFQILKKWVFHGIVTGKQVEYNIN